MNATLECNGVTKHYGEGALIEPVLKGVTLICHAGEACLLLGPSGSGKTTLLSILGCMLSPTGGEFHLSGKRVTFGKSNHLCEIRRRQIGFVFQHAQLLPFLSVEENLRVVGLNAGLSAEEVAQRIDDLTVRLGIEQIRRKKPGQVSGGQRQRVAIARALLHRPTIILADEPTAALDWQNGYAVMKLLREQTRQENALLITVTHDTRLIEFFDRVFHLDSGTLHEQ